MCFEYVAEKSLGSVSKERNSEWVTKMRVDDFLKVNVVDNFKCSKSLRLALRALTREKCFLDYIYLKFEPWVDMKVLCQ